MSKVRFKCELVASLPERLKPNILYVTVDKDVAGHLCACGCGREVITPISPTDWEVSFSRRGTSLSPSIGNWAFPCRSHYFIWDDAVVWARDMSDNAIEIGRRRSSECKQRYYDHQAGLHQYTTTETQNMPAPVAPVPSRSPVRKLMAWWRRRRGR